MVKNIGNLFLTKMLLEILDQESQQEKCKKLLLNITVLLRAI